MAETAEWVFDSIVAFLKSPLWSTPILTFIDRNCVIFDTEEENSLSFTTCHNEFKELVETLLEYHLEEMGVSGEEFVAACERGVDDPVGKAVFDAVMAAEDYFTFKEMMVARSRQLDRECLAMVRTMEAQPDVGAEEAVAAAVEGEGEEGAELAAAIRASKAAYAAMESARKAEETEEDAALRAAIAASLSDAEMARRSAEQEEADLRLAIARSLALDASAAEQPDDLLERAKAETKERARLAAVAKSAASSSLPTPPRPSAAASADARARQEYMARQRDLLLKVKQMEREKALSTYEEQSGKTASPAAKSFGSVFAPSDAPSPSKILPPLNASSAPVGSVRLRMALAAKLKDDMRASPSKPRPSPAPDAAGDAAARARQAELAARMDAERRAHLESMHEALRNAGADGDGDFVFDEDA